MSEMIFPQAVVDTSVLVKGLVPPRREKKDGLYQSQQKIYLWCKQFLEGIDSGVTRMIIPAVALVETAAVISRLTNDPVVAREAVTYLRRVASVVLHDTELWFPAIEIGIQTKSSGFDVLFLTCSKLTGAPLITDDKKLWEAAKHHGFSCFLVREMS